MWGQCTSSDETWPIRWESATAFITHWGDKSNLHESCSRECDRQRSFIILKYRQIDLNLNMSAWFYIQLILIYIYAANNGEIFSGKQQHSHDTQQITVNCVQSLDHGLCQRVRQLNKGDIQKCSWFCLDNFTTTNGDKWCNLHPIV